MFDFANPSLLWGLPLIGVPVLIHLINLLRHRRVQWAAMEFVLQSVKKNTNWIRFKELLLLLLRVLAVAAIVLMMARPRLQSEFGRLFGEGRTHHILILDDSFSMADAPSGEATCFERARAAIERIARDAQDAPSAQAITLVRFSQCGRVGRANRFDLAEAQVDSDFGRLLEETLRPLTASETAATPTAALAAVETLLGAADDSEREIYLLSDFRAKEWEQPGDMALALERLHRLNARVHLLDCADAERGNLGIASLTPAGGVEAAGVAFVVEVGVRNHGAKRETNVAVQLLQDGESLPPVTIDRIGPGDVETREFQVAFDKPGRHSLVARIEAERVGVPADNARHLALDLPAGWPVLLIDGDPRGVDSRFLARAMAPRGVVKSGLAPVARPPEFLNSNPLDSYSAIFLLNVPRLDRSASVALENYVRGGGGVCFFVGDACQIDHYNEELYRDGKGLLPAPLLGRISLYREEDQTRADLEVVDHPVFTSMTGERNGFLASVMLERYMGLARDWKPGPDSAVRTIATVRNGAPLILEAPFPRGRVVAVLTSAGPSWNNWCRNPSYPLLAQTLTAYLASRPGARAERLTGSPIVEFLSEASYRRQARFLAPEPGTAGAMREPATFDLDRNDAGQLEASFWETDSGGIYELELVTTENQPETRHFAINVDPLEGDLHKPSNEALNRSLANVPHELALADAFETAATESRGSQLSSWIQYLLVALLLGEQFLAFVASYHPVRATSAGARS